MSQKTHLRSIASLLVFSFLFFNVQQIVAQRSMGGTPASFEVKNRAVFDQTIKTAKVPALDIAQLKKEDRATPTNRFAAPVNVNFSLKDNGQWTDLDDGGRVWRFKIEAKGALGLFIFYKNFEIPVGGQLFVYDENQQQILGAYTYQNNAAHGKFMTGMIKGEVAIIEYFEPWYAKSKGHFEIDKIMQAYSPENLNPDDQFQRRSGFGESLPCHENINCSYGDNLQNQKRGVVRMLTVYNTGMGWCTGSLINNSAQDGEPYVLSAHHCGYLGQNIADFSLWRFDFNYEFPTCMNGNTEPGFSSILGCEVTANAEPSDFLLMRLSSNIPSAYNAFFNGWKRNTFLPDSAQSIHHPFGDVRKIAVDTHQLESYPFIIDWGDGVVTPPHSHYRSVLDVGTIEGGSSGAPYFSDGRIVGQLHGGVANCNTFITYHGKLSVSWDGADSAQRLSDWLDPAGLGIFMLNGIENPLVNNTSDIIGKVTKANGVTPVPNVEMQLTGAATLNMNNQSDGTYAFVDLLIDNDYTVTPFRNDEHREGVNTFDLALMKQHILGLGTPLDPYAIIAGDVDKNGTLNTIDMVYVQKIILQFDTEFPNNTAYRFVPADYVFQDPSDPLDENFPEANFYQPLLATVENQDFIAIKIGDVNHSATP